jgi:hypothetical protein
MSIAATVSRLFRRIWPSGALAKKPTWGSHSHIHLLADGLARDREGWVIGANAIHRNGVDIAWNGPLTAGGTTVTVKMDGQRFMVTADESRKLKERLQELLEASESG